MVFKSSTASDLNSQLRAHHPDFLELACVTLRFKLNHDVIHEPIVPSANFVIHAIGAPRQGCV